MNQLIDPALARNMAENADLASQQRKFDAMRRELNNGAPKDKKAKLREACEGFEAVFIQKMWEQMRATVPENGLMHGKDEKIWQGMYDQELSKKMAGAGGIGLADMMMAQLGKNLEEAGTKALNTNLNQRQPIPIAPAPLLIAPEAGVKAASPAPAAADIYSGAAESLAAPAGPVTETEAVPPEFEALVSRLQAEMRQPVVTVTRITTNATSLGDFNSIKPVRSGRGQTNPRVIRHTPPYDALQNPTPSRAASGIPPQAAVTPPREQEVPDSLRARGDNPAMRATPPSATAAERLVLSQYAVPDAAPLTAMSQFPTPAPVADPGPSVSPTAVSRARTSTLGMTPRIGR